MLTSISISIFYSLIAKQNEHSKYKYKITNNNSSNFVQSYYYCYKVVNVVCCLVGLLLWL